MSIDMLVVDAYATAGRPLAPPQPISTMLNVNVAITNLHASEQDFIVLL